MDYDSLEHMITYVYVCMYVYIYIYDTDLYIILICMQNCTKTSMYAVVQQ